MRQENITRGILYMVGFSLIAPLMDALAKATPHDVPVAQILAARFSIQVLVLVPLIWILRQAHRPSPREAALHLARGACLLAATGFFFTALRFIPMAEAISIFFIEPLILTVLSGIFLREDVGVRRISACIIGFIGALLIIQPNFVALGLPALLPLGTAFCFAGYMLLTRSMAQKSSPFTLQAYTAVAASVLILPLLWWFDGSGVIAFDPVWPAGIAVYTLIGVGIMATVSHLFISFALREAPASIIAPVQYTEIIAATLLGWMFFDELPNGLAWVGMTIIIASGLYVFARERKAAQEITAPPPPA